MLNGFTGHGAGYFRKVPPAMVEDVRAFGKRLLPLVGPANVSYTPGVVLHIWHGDRANRDYTHRYEILKGNAYDPVRDVRVNEQGVLEWATDKPKLHREVTEYFNNRKEGPKEARNKSIAKPEEDMWASADRQRKGLASFAKVQALGRARLWLLRLLGLHRLLRRHRLLPWLLLLLLPWLLLWLMLRWLPRLLCRLRDLLILHFHHDLQFLLLGLFLHRRCG